MQTTLKTSEDANYPQNEWRCKLDSKRVKMQTTLETSEDAKYTQNEWELYQLLYQDQSFHDIQEKLIHITRITLKTSEKVNYTQNEWKSKLHSKRVKK